MKPKQELTSIQKIEKVVAKLEKYSNKVALKTLNQLGPVFVTAETDQKSYCNVMTKYHTILPKVDMVHDVRATVELGNPLTMPDGTRGWGVKITWIPRTVLGYFYVFCLLKAVEAIDGYKPNQLLLDKIINCNQISVK
jgi:hypothetical protein